MNPDRHTMTGAYAVGALSGEERRAFESHLAECAECAQEVGEFEATAARLGAAEETVPPPRMRAAVLERISQVRQLPPDIEGDGGLPVGPGPEPGAGPDAGSPDVGPDAAPPSPPPSGPIPLQDRQRRASGRRSLSTWIASAAAAVLLAIAAALGAVSVNLNNELADLRAESGEVSRVLAAPDARTVSASVGAGWSSVVFSEQLGRAVFAAAGLDEPPDGRTYQLWYVGAQGARSAGLFQPDANGEVTQLLEGDLADAQAIAFTVERAGGSAQPTSPPLAALELTA